MNILFVCSKNQWRRPTAAAIYKNRSDINVRSAGTSSTARIKISEKNIQWADVIFVMEKKHKTIIMQKFSFEIDHKIIISLEIPDDFQFMDIELINDIKTKVDWYLQNDFNN